MGTVLNESLQHAAFGERAGQGVACSRKVRLPREMHIAGRRKDLIIKGGRNYYPHELEAAGFDHIEFEDMTATWSQFVCERHQTYVRARERHVRVHGEVTFTNLELFYRAMVTLFGGPSLRGVRVSATKIDSSRS